MLSLNVLAHNLLNLGRCIAERAQTKPGRPKTHGRQSAAMSLRTFRQRYLKVPARVTLHSRRVWISIAPAAAVLWHSWWDYLQRLGSLPMID